VRINYYPPRGDNKEGWDNIDIFGWLGYPMQIKINFLCRDSILAAPIVLDSRCSWTWRSAPACAASRSGCRSTSRAPMHAPGLYPEHDLFIQLMKLKNTLRYLKGEELITHLGLEYYEKARTASFGVWKSPPRKWPTAKASLVNSENSRR
jgi:myo-inositol-1-phosphate synthase